VTARLSIVVRTLHERPALLARVLDALRAQDLALEDWELLLIENSPAPRDEPSLGWHPQARRLHEPRRGKLPALRLGLASARGAVAVVVDDDNVLAPDYLRHVGALFEDPGVGTANGVVSGEFEEPPPPWIHLFDPDLALWDPGHERRTGLSAYGAGLAARRVVFEAFLRSQEQDPRRRLYGPAGFDAGEDLDLASHASRLGLHHVFAPELRLRHWIAKERVGSRGLVRLARVNACAFAYTRLLATDSVTTPLSWWRALARDLGCLPAGGWMMFRRRRALRAGRRDARRFLASEPADQTAHATIEG
jgi:hypothetical protein